VAFAAKIFKDQLTIFINFQEGAEPAPEATGHPKSSRSSTRTCGSRWTIWNCPVRFGQLPTEREHPLHRRVGAANRIRNAEDQELWAQVAQGDQRDLGQHGFVIGHGNWKAGRETVRPKKA